MGLARVVTSVSSQVSSRHLTCATVVGLSRVHRKPGVFSNTGQATALPCRTEYV
jgi:hypothetical protein